MASRRQTRASTALKHRQEKPVAKAQAPSKPAAPPADRWRVSARDLAKFSGRDRLLLEMWNSGDTFASMINACSRSFQKVYTKQGIKKIITRLRNAIEEAGSDDTITAGSHLDAHKTTAKPNQAASQAATSPRKRARSDDSEEDKESPSKRTKHRAESSSTDTSPSERTTTKGSNEPDHNNEGAVDSKQEQVRSTAEERLKAQPQIATPSHQLIAPSRFSMIVVSEDEDNPTVVSDSGAVITHSTMAQGGSDIITDAKLLRDNLDDVDPSIDAQPLDAQTIGPNAPASQDHTTGRESQSTSTATVLPKANLESQKRLLPVEFRAEERDGHPQKKQRTSSSVDGNQGSSVDGATKPMETSEAPHPARLILGIPVGEATRVPKLISRRQPAAARSQPKRPLSPSKTNNANTVSGARDPSSDNHQTQGGNHVSSGKDASSAHVASSEHMASYGNDASSAKATAANISNSTPETVRAHAETTSPSQEVSSESAQIAPPSKKDDLIAAHDLFVAAMNRPLNHRGWPIGGSDEPDFVCTRCAAGYDGVSGNYSNQFGVTVSKAEETYKSLCSRLRRAIWELFNHNADDFTFEYRKKSAKAFWWKMRDSLEILAGRENLAAKEWLLMALDKSDAFTTECNFDKFSACELIEAMFMALMTSRVLTQEMIPKLKGPEVNCPELMTDFYAHLESEGRYKALRLRYQWRKFRNYWVRGPKAREAATVEAEKLFQEFQSCMILFAETEDATLPEPGAEQLRDTIKRFILFKCELELCSRSYEFEWMAKPEEMFNDEVMQTGSMVHKRQTSWKVEPRRRQGIRSGLTPALFVRKPKDEKNPSGYEKWELERQAASAAPEAQPTDAYGPREVLCKAQVLMWDVLIAELEDTEVPDPDDEGFALALAA